MSQEEKWFDKVRHLRKRRRRDIVGENRGHNIVRKDSGELLTEHSDTAELGKGGHTQHTSD